MSAPTVVPVTGAAPYDVVIGRGLMDRLPGLLGEAQRVALVFDGALTGLAEEVTAALPGRQVLPLSVPSGEQAKSVAVAASCWDALGEAGFTRSDAVVTLGGGATTDLGGWVAAAWLRGVRVAHVPTTLLAMVDAAVGGKTGVNTAAGKNLVGAFHEPSGVLCDLALLDGLPGADLVAGMGEVVKCGFIADPEILTLVESGRAFEPSVLRELVERAVRVKADVVVADLLEAGGPDGHPGREILNYGHTMAHAIERATGYTMRHGDAVAIGCCYAAAVAGHAGLIPDALVERHLAAFAGVGLPVGWAGASFEDLRATMAVDKKSRGSRLRFVVLHDLAVPRTLAGPSEEVLRAAYDDMVAHA